jgi:hypothetical protein
VDTPQSVAFAQEELAPISSQINLSEKQKNGG